MKNIHTTIAVNEFVKRQIKGSGKTYSKSLTFNEIANHAQNQISKGNYKLGYRDGVILAKVKDSLIDQFICPFVKINKTTKLKAKITKRRSEEKPYIQIRAQNGTPIQASSVDLILYRHDILAESNEQTTNKEWELISFHAIPKDIIEMPMGPVTMMRNQLELTGGTKAHYSYEEWAASIKFWQEYAVLDI